MNLWFSVVLWAACGESEKRVSGGAFGALCKWKWWIAWEDGNAWRWCNRTRLDNRYGWWSQATGRFHSCSRQCWPCSSLRSSACNYWSRWEVTLCHTYEIENISNDQGISCMCSDVPITLNTSFLEVFEMHLLFFTCLLIRLRQAILFSFKVRITLWPRTVTMKLWRPFKLIRRPYLSNLLNEICVVAGLQVQDKDMRDRTLNWMLFIPILYNKLY